MGEYINIKDAMSISNSFIELWGNFKVSLNGLVINNIKNIIIKIIDPRVPVDPHAKNERINAIIGKKIFLLLFK